MKPRALYLHIPFCKAKCLYCDFESRALGGCELDAAVARYCRTLSSRIDALGSAGALDDVETVYVGGGTPSLLGSRLVSLVERVRAFCDPVEFTCEANPESFSRELAWALHGAGVTRISLGVQTLDPSELAAIGRIHSAEEAMAAVTLAKTVGFSTSCDIMCGLPGQTVESFCRSLRSLIGLQPDHVSVYPLQLEEGTPLCALEERGAIDVPDDDVQAACMDRASDFLTGAGFARYEVASYAKPGHRCRHNIAYWTGIDYLGLGRSAAGMCNTGAGGRLRPGDEGRVRYRQLDDAGEQFETERLSVRQAAAEDLMLACRMTDGISIDLLERSAEVIFEDDLRAACLQAIGLGLVRWDGRALKPTHLGWLDGNELFGIFWDLAE